MYIVSVSMKINVTQKKSYSFFLQESNMTIIVGWAHTTKLNRKKEKAQFHSEGN